MSAVTGQSEGVTKQEALELRDEVRSMFYHAYNNYMEHAFPLDELRPLSCGGEDSLGGYSLTLIDAMDTLALLGDVKEFSKAVRWISRHVDFDKNKTVSIFETNIRVLGGLLSAHLLASDPSTGMAVDGYDGKLLDLAKDLGQRFLPAFYTPTGIPFGSVNLQSGIPPEETTVTSTAAGGTLAVEFGMLSRLTSDPVFEDLALQSLRGLWSRRSHLGLVGAHIDVYSGEWTHRDAGIGTSIDSFYEYLLKAHLLLGGDEYLHMFTQAYQSAMQHLHVPPWYVEVNMDDGMLVWPLFNSLQAFWPGLQVLAGDVEAAAETHAAFYGVWRRFGFTPEGFNLLSGDVQPGQNSYPLRPELAESTYWLYRATRDPMYLHVGRDIITSIQYGATCPCGYCHVADVKTHEKEDHMESFFLSETVKYLWLLFDSALGGDNLVENGPYPYVFSTEGHLFPIRPDLSLEKPPPTYTPNKPAPEPDAKAVSADHQSEPQPKISQPDNDGQPKAAASSPEIFSVPDEIVKESADVREASENGAGLVMSESDGPLETKLSNFPVGAMVTETAGGGSTGRSSSEDRDGKVDVRKDGSKDVIDNANGDSGESGRSDGSDGEEAGGILSGEVLRSEDGVPAKNVEEEIALDSGKGTIGGGDAATCTHPGSAQSAGKFEGVPDASEIDTESEPVGGDVRRGALSDVSRRAVGDVSRGALDDKVGRVIEGDVSREAVNDVSRGALGDVSEGAVSGVSGGAVDDISGDATDDVSDQAVCDRRALDDISGGTLGDVSEDAIDHVNRGASDDISKNGTNTLGAETWEVWSDEGAQPLVGRCPALSFWRHVGVHNLVPFPPSADTVTNLDQIQLRSKQRQMHQLRMASFLQQAAQANHVAQPQGQRFTVTVDQQGQLFFQQVANPPNAAPPPKLSVTPPVTSSNAAPPKRETTPLESDPAPVGNALETLSTDNPRCEANPNSG